MWNKLLYKVLLSEMKGKDQVCIFIEMKICLWDVIPNWTEKSFTQLKKLLGGLKLMFKIFGNKKKNHFIKANLCLIFSHT